MPFKIKHFSTNGGSKCDGCTALTKKLDDMHETLEQQKQEAYQQNMKICDILAEHKVLLTELLNKNKAIDTVMKIFPINSESQLHELENLLEGQKDLYVRYIKSLIKGEISKNLGKVLGRNVVMEFNAEGVQGKKRLKDFENFYDAITDAISDDRPEEKFKSALQHEKQKYHNLKSKQKSKENRALVNVDNFNNFYEAFTDSISDERSEENFQSIQHHKKQKYNIINLDQ